MADSAMKAKGAGGAGFYARVTLPLLVVHGVSILVLLLSCSKQKVDLNKEMCPILHEVLTLDRPVEGESPVRYFTRACANKVKPIPIVVRQEDNIPLFTDEPWKCISTSTEYRIVDYNSLHEDQMFILLGLKRKDDDIAYWAGLQSIPFPRSGEGMLTTYGCGRTHGLIKKEGGQWRAHQF